MARSVTVRDIAQSARVSNGTVSRVFHNQHNVDPILRQRVLRAAAELGYDKVPLHSQSETGLLDIGFLLFLPDVAEAQQPPNSFWAAMLNGAQKEAQKHGLRLMYFSFNPTQTAPEAVVDIVLNYRLKGLLLVNTPSLATVRQLQLARIPLVLLDEVIRDFPADAVVADNYEGGKQATEYLLQRGHRQIAMLGADPNSMIYSFAWRTRGYGDALAEAHIPTILPLMEPCSPHLGDGYAKDGYEACQRLLQRDVPFSAVFCANDAIAIGALRAFHEHGKAVPRDVSVVSFDDDLATHAVPALTSVRVEKEAMGAAALAQLLARVQQPESVPRTITLRVSLIERQSARDYHQE